MSCRWCVEKESKLRGWAMSVQSRLEKFLQTYTKLYNPSSTTKKSHLPIINIRKNNNLNSLIPNQEITPLQLSLGIPNLLPTKMSKTIQTPSTTATNTLLPSTSRPESHLSMSTNNSLRSSSTTVPATRRQAYRPMEPPIIEPRADMRWAFTFQSQAGSRCLWS